MKKFHTGGVIGPRSAVLHRGVVGYIAGRPVFDGEWFDQQMAALGPVIAVVSAERTPPGRLPPPPRRR